ncbi:DUF2989 domain-containing protein [Desulfovibrio ferrophilus]|uniref:Response regulatory domain-containing protein n=1 Tax=Desulfovibrio ferrophilus TaxID=241368 RepID=A0A2Z6AXY8_9BACT|nr:DUF2989 domain-containing protein [Desulfovibrio ferrophilus]BBD08063.1 hypothetical protein DFE_1337 [Desulfovibrio ferrophilus]
MADRKHNEQLITEIINLPVSTSINYSFYEETIRQYVLESNGRFLIYSTDRNFTAFLRKTLSLASVNPKSLGIIRKENDILRHIRLETNHGRNVILFIDGDYVSKEMGAVIKQLKSAYDNLKIIVLTGEADVDDIALLHEIGADNFIIKPISTNSLVVKIAFTIKPHGKIGKYIDEGKKFMALRLFDEAAAIAGKVLKVKPDSAAAFMLMGDALSAMGQTDQALQAYEQASDCARMYLEPLKKLANFHRQQGHKENELSFLERLDELSPLNVSRKVDMGELYLELGREEEADNTFEQAMEHVTRAAMTQVAMISVQIADAYLKKNPSKSEEFYKKAMNVKGFDLKANIDIFNRLGTALRKQGKWEEAVREYGKALELSPNDENLYYNTAMAYADGGHAQKAFHSLEKTLELNDNFLKKNHIITFNCALIASNSGRKERAAIMCKAALKLNPNYEKATKMLKELSPDATLAGI